MWILAFEGLDSKETSPSTGLPIRSKCYYFGNVRSRHKPLCSQNRKIFNESKKEVVESSCGKPSGINTLCENLSCGNQTRSWGWRCSCARRSVCAGNTNQLQPTTFLCCHNHYLLPPGLRNGASSTTHRPTSSVTKADASSAQPSPSPSPITPLKYHFPPRIACPTTASLSPAKTRFRL